MPEQFTSQFEKAAPAVKTKECSMCHLFKPLKDYSWDGRKLRPNCNVCNGNRHVTCGGCHTKKPEREMKIYSVRDGQVREGEEIGRYYCNQPCKNIADGVKRDVNGFIRAWL